jgi:hypothetical protein
MAAAISGLGLILELVIYLVGFLVSAVVLGWIIRIGVEWGIMRSTDHIRGAVREAILSTQPRRKR